MGGDLKKIQVVGDYMIEIWKAVGMERIGDKARACAHAHVCVLVCVCCVDVHMPRATRDRRKRAQHSSHHGLDPRTQGSTAHA